MRAKTLILILCLGVAVHGTALDRDKVSMVVTLGISYNYLIKKAFYESWPQGSSGDIDAVSSPTKMGYNAGVHLGYKIQEQNFDSGLDFHFDQAAPEYHDSKRNVVGERSLALAGISLSSFYNVSFFPNRHSDPTVKFGLGFFGTYYPYHKATATGTLDSGKISDWSFGPDIRFSYFPFEVADRRYLGLYVDLQQSVNQIYLDHYFNNSAAWKLGKKSLGVAYHF